MAILEGLAIGAQVLGGLLGGISESPRERAAREARQRLLEGADRLSRLSENQRREAELFGERVEGSRRFGAGQVSASANEEGVGLFSRLLSRQRSLQSQAMNAARAGLNVNVNPALTDTFSDVGSAGSRVEQVRAQGLLQNEQQAMQGRERTQMLRNQADALAAQAEQIRGEAERIGVMGARESTGIANVLAGAALGGQVGKSLMDLDKAFDGGIERGISSLGSGVASGVGSLFGGGQASAPSGVGGQVMPVYNPMSHMYMPFQMNNGGLEATGYNLGANAINQMLFQNAVNEQNRVYGALGGVPVQRRAMGGRVEAGMPYVVGDSPDGMPTGNEELFVPDQDGTILPSQNTMSMMAGEEETPYTGFLKAIREEVASMEEEEEEIAKKLLEGTGFEFLVQKRKKKRKTS